MAWTLGLKPPLPLHKPSLAAKPCSGMAPWAGLKSRGLQRGQQLLHGPWGQLQRRVPPPLWEVRGQRGVLCDFLDHAGAEEPCTWHNMHITWLKSSYSGCERRCIWLALSAEPVAVCVWVCRHVCGCMHVCHT